MDLSNLITMIQQGDDEAVKSIIEDFHLRNEVDSNFTTLLHYAAKCGNINIAKYLLLSGCSVDPQDVKGETPLIMAMRGNHEEIVKVLLEAGASMDVLDLMGKSVLHYFAAEHKFSLEVRKIFLQEFLERCSTIEDAAKKMINAGCHLYQAVYLKNSGITDYLLQQGLSANSTNPLNKRTALHVSVAMEDVKSVQLLLKYDANVNAMDNNGKSPLHYIFQQNEGTTREKLKILQMLLDAGASSTSCTSIGVFQVNSALCRGDREVIRMVLQSNINFAAKDKYKQRSILHLLAMNRSQGVAEELIHYASKFDVNVIDDLTLSPLIIAVVFANVGMVKFFLDQGADIDYMENTFGYPALFYAYSNREFEKEYDECIELFLQYNANPQLISIDKNNERITIFDAASKENWLNKTRPVVAHLAKLEALGSTINEIIYSKINSYPDLKTYFNQCRRVLKRKVFKSLTALKLFTGDKKKLAPYLSNKQSMIKLERLSHKLRAVSYYSFYYKILKSRLSKMVYDKRFKYTASKVLSKILRPYFHETHLALGVIVNYLTHKDLCQLYQF